MHKAISAIRNNSQNFGFSTSKRKEFNKQKKTNESIKFKSKNARFK